LRDQSTLMSDFNEPIAILEDSLSADAIGRVVAHSGAGAVVTFLGIVRDNAQGRAIDYLEYSAYAPMARREMSAIADEVRERWGLPCAIWHRVGRLQIGEASVAIAVAAPHRHQAFEACEWVLNRVKETVPIWKKEVARDGYWWVEDPCRRAPSS
jgi:molybdopterin synthase catalytic subunit